MNGDRSSLDKSNDYKSIDMSVLLNTRDNRKKTNWADEYARITYG